MRVLVCGGRDFNNERVLNDALDDFHRSHHITCLIHDGAMDADRLASKWAAKHGVETFSYPADWDNLGRRAGPVRNAVMLKEGRPMAVIAFPGERGTADMCGKAQAAGVDVYAVRVRGSEWEVEAI